MIAYCNGDNDRGLTCAPSHLVLERRLTEDSGAGYVNRQRVYRCSVCGGYYKHVYAERSEQRNFDAEGGLHILEDLYLKVGDVRTSTLRFTLAEARLYGYRGGLDEG